MRVGGAQRGAGSRPPPAARPRHPASKRRRIAGIGCGAQRQNAACPPAGRIEACGRRSAAPAGAAWTTRARPLESGTGGGGALHRARPSRTVTWGPACTPCLGAFGPRQSQIASGATPAASCGRGCLAREGHAGASGLAGEPGSKSPLEGGSRIPKGGCGPGRRIGACPRSALSDLDAAPCVIAVVIGHAPDRTDRRVLFRRFFPSASRRTACSCGRQSRAAPWHL